MNKELIKKYKIDFRNQVYNGKVNKFPMTNHEELTEFLFGWKVSELDEYVLPDIDKVLNGIQEEAENGKGTVFINI